MRDPLDGLVRLIVEVEAVANAMNTSKSKTAILASCERARQHLPVAGRSADLSDEIKSRSAERVEMLRLAAEKHLTTPVSRVELEKIVDSVYGPDTNVIQLAPRRKAEDPIARSVRMCRQLTGRDPPREA